MEFNVTVAGFLVLKKFGYLSVIAFLSLVRGIIGRGILLRLLAIVALLISLVGLAAQTAPEALGLYKGAIFTYSWKIRTYGGGLAILVAASVPLMLSAWMPRRRWVWIDITHAVLVIVTLILWLLIR